MSWRATKSALENLGRSPEETAESLGRAVRARLLLGFFAAVLWLGAVPLLGSDAPSKAGNLLRTAESVARLAWTRGERLLGDLRLVYRMHHLDEVSLQSAAPAPAPGAKLSLCKAKPGSGPYATPPEHRSRS